MRTVSRNILYHDVLTQRRRHAYADLGVSEGIFTSKSNNRGCNIIYARARACIRLYIHTSVYYCLIIIIIIAEPKLFDPVSMSLFYFFSYS